jgi:putative inorganic carbon (HCO3(-)) transporter
VIARAWASDVAARWTRQRLVVALVAVALGAAVAAVTPLLGAAVFAAAVVLPIALASPLFALCLAIVVIPLSSEWSVTVGGLNLTLMEPAVGLAVLAWFVRAARARTLRVWPSALLAAQLLVLVLFLVSSLGAEERGPSLKDTLKWIELVLIFTLTVDEARDARAARWVVLAVIGAGALEASYGIFQFVTGRGPDFFAIGPFMRAYGHFGQPNPFAGYLGTALPLALAIALLLARDSLGRWAQAATALLAAGVLLSFSRGAWLGVGCAAAVMLAVASARSRRWLVPLGAALLLFAVVGALGLLPASIAERINVVAEYFGPFDVRNVDLNSENWSVVERMAHWQAAWYMFLDHPWLGIGPGNYSTAYEQYYLPGWLEPLGHAHNYYLNLAAELGLIGLSAYLLVLALAIRAAIRGLRATDPFWRTVALGTLGSLVAIALHSAFDNLYVHGVSVQIGALFALVQLASRRAAEEGALSAPWHAPMRGALAAPPRGANAADG